MSLFTDPLWQLREAGVRLFQPIQGGCVSSGLCDDVPQGDLFQRGHLLRDLDNVHGMTGLATMRHRSHERTVWHENNREESVTE